MGNNEDSRYGFERAGAEVLVVVALAIPLVVEGPEVVVNKDCAGEEEAGEDVLSAAEEFAA